MITLTILGLLIIIGIQWVLLGDTRRHLIRTQSKAIIATREAESAKAYLHALRNHPATRNHYKEDL